MFCEGAVERRVTLLTSRSRWSDREVTLPSSSSSSRGAQSQHRGRGGGQDNVSEWLSTIDKEDAKPELPRHPSADSLSRNLSSEDDLALGVEASLYGKPGFRSVPEFLRLTQSSPAISRWNSLNSAVSGQTGTLSLMDVLNLWADDPEEVLLDMGFGFDEPDISCRIPSRFINHQSQARGINIQVFLEAQKTRLDLENPDVRNRFRQLEVLQQVTTAFTSIKGPSSGALPGREQNPEARERRRRMGNLLRRASKKYLSQKQTQSVQEQIQNIQEQTQSVQQQTQSVQQQTQSIQEQTQSVQEQTPGFPDTPPQPPQPIASLAEKQAPPRRTRPGLQEVLSLSPLVEEQGLVTDAHPQSLVAVHAQDGGSRLGLVKEVHPLTSRAVLYRKRNPAPAKESFEMEEIQSFDDGSFTSSSPGTADGSTVRGVMVRTSSCQSDSSGFLEEPVIPVLLPLPAPAPSVAPGPDLIKALSGMSGSSTESQVTVRETTSDPPSPTSPTAPSLPPSSCPTAPSLPPSSSPSAPSLPPSSSPSAPSLPLMSPSAISPFLTRSPSPIPPSPPRSSSPISSPFPLSPSPIPPSLPRSPSPLPPSSSPTPPSPPCSPSPFSPSIPIPPSSSPLPSSLPPSPFLASHSLPPSPISPSIPPPPPSASSSSPPPPLTAPPEEVTSPSDPSEGASGSSSPAEGPGPRARRPHAIPAPTTQSGALAERSSLSLSEGGTAEASLGSEVAPAVAVSTGEASLHVGDTPTRGSGLTSAPESDPPTGSGAVDGVSMVPDEKAGDVVAETDGPPSAAETRTEESPDWREERTEDGLLRSHTPEERSRPLPDVRPEPPPARLQHREAAPTDVTRTEEGSWTLLEEVPSPSPPSSENTLSSSAPSPHSPSPLPSSSPTPSSSSVLAVSPPSLSPLPSLSPAPSSPPSVPSVSSPPPLSPPPPSPERAEVLALSQGAEKHSACESSKTGAGCHNNGGGDGGRRSPALAPVHGVIKPETDGSATGPLTGGGTGLASAADRLQPARSGWGPGGADGPGTAQATAFPAAVRPGGPVLISSLDLVFGSTSVDDPDGEWPCEDVDAVCRELDSDGHVYWAEPILLASRSASTEGTSRAGSVESTDRPLVLRPDPDLAPSSAFDRINMGTFSSQSQTHQNPGATAGVTAHPERKSVFGSSRSVSVQMSSSLSSSRTVSKATVKPSVVSTSCADSPRPVHLHQSEADFTPGRSVLAKRAWSEAASSSHFSRGDTVVTVPGAASPLSSTDLGVFSGRDDPRSATGSLRTKSVSLDTGLWPGDEEEEEEEEEEGRGGVTRRWEEPESRACRRRCSCCRQSGSDRTPAADDFPYSVEELEELMRCLRKFRQVLTDIEEQVSEDQASVYSALSSSDREEAGDIVELRTAVKKEVEELEGQLNDLVHHYDDSFKMKMHRLLDEQSLLCSELRLLPSATTPTHIHHASSRCASTQCCLLPWLPLMDRSETRLSSRGTWDLESSRPSLLGCDSIVEGLDDSALKPDKLDFVGFLQRLKESLRNSINADSLE